MTPPLLEAYRAWFAALNAARRARTPRTRPRSSREQRDQRRSSEAGDLIRRSAPGAPSKLHGARSSVLWNEPRGRDNQSSSLAVALPLKPGKPYRPLVPPASHPIKWRTTTTIPAHAPRLNATADQRMIMECQSISFMAPP